MKKQGKLEREPASKDSKAYEKPEVKDLGHVRDVTKGFSGAVPDLAMIGSQ